MPEYLAPGVYLEETSFRSKSIEGVSTTTTGLIGPTRYGPTDQTPDVITSREEFERVYGDGQPLQFIATKENGDPDVDAVTNRPTLVSVTNFMWHAVRAFFQEGGKRLYVVRTFRRAGADDAFEPNAQKKIGDGVGDFDLAVRARWPGRAGRRRVRLTLALGQSALSFDRDGNARITGLSDWDVVWVGQADASSPPASTFDGEFFLAHFQADTRTWELIDRDGNAQGLIGSPPQGEQVCPVTLFVNVFSDDPLALPQTWGPLALDGRHKRGGRVDSVLDVFGNSPENASESNGLPVVFSATRSVGGEDQPVRPTGLAVLDKLLDPDTSNLLSELSAAGPDETRDYDFMLDGGNDGVRPTDKEYEGDAPPDRPIKLGLKAFEDIEDISIVAAPGSTFGYEQGFRDQADSIIGKLITHCTQMRYRIAVLDSGDGQSIRQVRQMRGKIDSTYAAFYYPWVRIMDPITQRPLHLPPSGFVAGIYARNDIARAVYKAPANEVVNLSIGFEHFLNKAQQEVLNPEGINCFRFFEGRGHRLWGARTATSDQEWKYVNLRRYFAYLEHSIDKGTQWAVFEPNGERLWENIRHTIDSFLLNEWQGGALLGDKPEAAYFVRCDRSTMTQNDIDNGRLVVLVGVAALRPAEFVIIRIGQWTADRKS